MVQINTDAVKAAAENIDAVNKRIRDELYDVDRSIRALQQCWEGEAADAFTYRYEYLKREFADARFAVIDSMVSFMKNQVGEGYSLTECAISSAAAEFK